jgi:ferrochelatase
LADKDNTRTIGVVLLNLGGPDSLRAIRPFLYNLFSDREIIRLGPSFLQKPLAMLISTFRSKKTVKMYNLIGGRSPILDITRAQAEALEKALNSSQLTAAKSPFSFADEASEPPPRGEATGCGKLVNGLQFKVYIGMRYWGPFIMDTLGKVIKDGIRHIIVLSLYPQYSKATTGSSVTEFKKSLDRLHTADYKLQIAYIEQWYDFPPYIDSFAELIYNGISEFHKQDVEILFSAHNLPEDFIRDGDPYIEHTKCTIKKIMKRLAKGPYNLPDLKWHLAFQSKSGPVRWMQPGTDEMIIRLADEGIKNILAVPVSFVSDHIETLYEIDILYNKLAEKHGVNLKRCKSLNTSWKFIEALKELVLKETHLIKDEK